MFLKSEPTVFIPQKHLIVLISLLVSSQAEPPRSYGAPPTPYLPPSPGCLSCYPDPQPLPLQPLPSPSYGTPIIRPQPQIIFPPQPIYQPPRQTYAPPIIRPFPQPLPTYSAPGPGQTIIQPFPTPIVQPLPSYSAPSIVQPQQHIKEVHFRPNGDAHSNINFITKSHFIKEDHYKAPYQPPAIYGAPNIGQPIDYIKHHYISEEHHAKPIGGSGYLAPSIQPTYSVPGNDFHQKKIVIQPGINDFSTGTGSFNGYNYKRPNLAF